MKEIDIVRDKNSYDRGMNAEDYGTNGFIASTNNIPDFFGESFIGYDFPRYYSFSNEKVYELIVTMDNDVSLTVSICSGVGGLCTGTVIGKLTRSGTYHFYFKRGEKKVFTGKLCFTLECLKTFKISEVKLREWEPSEIFERLQLIDNEGMQPKETALESKVSNISAKFDELSDFLKTFTENDMSHVNGENIEKIGELQALLQSYDEKLSAMVGKYVRIAPECKEYFNQNHEPQPLAENDILRSMIFTVKSYQSGLHSSQGNTASHNDNYDAKDSPYPVKSHPTGLYVLSSPQNADILVSFEMVTRV